MERAFLPNREKERERGRDYRSLECHALPGKKFVTIVAPLL